MSGWLVLSRYEGETLVFDLGGGETIEIRVNRVSGKRAWLAMNAPERVAIVRDDAKQQQQRASTDPQRGGSLPRQRRDGPRGLEAAGSAKRRDQCDPRKP